ncbi:hypothetical protein TNCV_307471 [Trichonephila clavipes]|nr:hypothetical protein TNCV_307471 [Trichonephila clavipes]
MHGLLLGRMKSMVYETAVPSVEDHIVRISVIVGRMHDMPEGLLERRNRMIPPKTNLASDLPVSYRAYRTLATKQLNKD